MHTINKIRSRISQERSLKAQTQNNLKKKSAEIRLKIDRLKVTEQALMLEKHESQQVLGINLKTQYECMYICMGSCVYMLSVEDEVSGKTI